MKLGIPVVAVTFTWLVSGALAQTAPATATIASRVDTQMKAYAAALKKDPTGNECINHGAALYKLLDEERTNPDASKIHPLAERVTALYKLLELDAGLILDPKTDGQKADLVKQVTFTLGAGKETPKPGTPDFDRLVKFGSDVQTSQRYALFQVVMTCPADDFNGLAARVSEMLPDKPTLTSRAAVLKATLELAKAGKLPK